MISQRSVQVKVVPATMKHWKSMGYSCSVGDSINVDVNHLKDNSNVIISCVCDECGENYTQRYARNTDLCSGCQRKQNMRGNTHGTKNKKYETPPERDLLELIDNGLGKSHIAKKYGVSIPVVNEWIKTHGIDIQEYHGKKYFKTTDEKKNVIESITNTHRDNPTWNITDISKHLSIPRHILYQMKNDGDVSIKTQFDFWNDSLMGIVDNIDFYLEENKNKDLKTISEEQNISIEQLKRAFRDTGNTVILHSYNKSKGELECADFIRSLGYESKSTRIQGYEIDCFVEDRGFGVEYCGEYWHRYTPEKNNKYYHRDKQQHFKKLGISLLTIFEHEWIEKREIVESMIRSRLGMCKKIHARKCEVRCIQGGEANQFHSNNHLSGHCNSSIHIGLFHENVLTSVLSLTKSRFDKNYEYEISRFSTMVNHTVVGGLSKMFSYFVKEYNPQSCMTYSDLRVGEGKSYMSIGFHHVGNTPPNYFYYDKKAGIVESRHKFQKHKLKDMAGYSIDKTEFEIMDSEGYYRVYDCGNVKYIWSKYSHENI